MWFAQKCFKERGYICDVPDMPFCPAPTTLSPKSSAAQQPKTTTYLSAAETTTDPSIPQTTTDSSVPQTTTDDPTAQTTLFSLGTVVTSHITKTSPAAALLPSTMAANTAETTLTTTTTPSTSENTRAGVSSSGSKATACMVKTSARQRSTFNDAAAAKAIDGDPNTCSVTGRERASWLRIQLGCQATITAVTLIVSGTSDIRVIVGNAEDTRGFRAGWEAPSSTICASSGGKEGESGAAVTTRTLTCANPVTGQFLYIVSLSSSHRHMTLCDVTVTCHD